MIHYLTYAVEKKLNLTSLFMIVFLSIKIHHITNIYWYHKLLQRYLTEKTEILATYFFFHNSS